MVTLLPPAIVCTPEIPFDGDWHDPNRVMYNPENKTTPLIYYQPVLLFGAAIQVGVKGKIANCKSKKDRPFPTIGGDDDDDEPRSLPSAQKGECINDIEDRYYPFIVRWIFWFSYQESLFD